MFGWTREIRAANSYGWQISHGILNTDLFSGSGCRESVAASALLLLQHTTNYKSWRNNNRHFYDQIVDNLSEPRGKRIIDITIATGG